MKEALSWYYDRASLCWFRVPKNTSIEDDVVAQVLFYPGQDIWHWKLWANEEHRGSMVAGSSQHGTAEDDLEAMVAADSVLEEMGWTLENSKAEGWVSRDRALRAMAAWDALLEGRCPT